MIGMDRRTGRRAEGVDHLAQSIEDILTTPLGTRLCRRDYGCFVPELLDQPNNPLGRIRVFAATATALLRQEGRLRLRRVTLSPGATSSSAVIGITGSRTDVAGPHAALTLSIPVRALSAADAA